MSLWANLPTYPLTHFGHLYFRFYEERNFIIIYIIIYIIIIIIRIINCTIKVDFYP